MPLQAIEFHSAEEINTLILNLRKRKILNEVSLAQEYIVTIDGRTYPVSKIKELSDEECDKYSDIKFLARIKERPEKDEDFIICSLKEFKDSTNKENFVYNKMFVDALLAIDKGRTIHNKRYPYQNIALQSIDAQCALSHADIIFPAITPYSNTYEAIAILKYLKSNIDKGLKVSDPSTHFLGYLPPDKIAFNRALASLIIINHQNFIKNKSNSFLKTVKEQKNEQAALQEVKTRLEKHLNNLQESIEISKSIETEILLYKEVLKQRYEQLEKKESRFKEIAEKETMGKYIEGDFSDYNRLKKKLTDINADFKNKLTNLKGRLYILPLLGALIIVIAIILGITEVVNGLISSFLAGGGLATGIGGLVIRSTRYHDQRECYAIIIKETNLLLTKIDEINKLQETIELTKRHQNLCASMLQSIASFDLITLLENEIPEPLRLPENELTSFPPLILSSSEYLLKTAGKNSSREKAVKEITREEKEEKKSAREEVTIDMGEDVTESSRLLSN